MTQSILARVCGQTLQSSNSPVVDSKPGNGFEGVDDLVNRRELQLAIALDKAESWLWLSVALLLRLGS